MNGTSKSSYGNCDTCDQPQTDNGWCSVCQTKIFQENFINWTSGNQKIDELIQETQINPINPGRILEWIPYEKIKIVKKIGKGGFSTIYEAIWIDGPIVWDGVKLNRKSNCKIALKNLDTSSESLSDEYLNELKLHLRCNNSGQLSLKLPNTTGILKLNEN
ncbi:19788_t:CDS:2 [Entrophospora sp. SA101]|nr:19788_t:CDS:2 [Entrophospora sp. SA101]